ncbi:MmcQ/YjbR family DNA-binding protein [uncultured Anaerovibrio sp.]|uniref:MmcQ/YjbR family DNA-binding protein n=1 Tax=uncultured Anaerovibrio sp. TaxID=361586 RepID=UPI00260F70B0|nr:MmcQ/YjbR family DNA-binding protein [uncultured Anaerovibrio sp.]
MTKKQALEYIKGTYGVDEDYPWEELDAFVFRHRVSQKWFCLFMDIPANRLGLEEDTSITVINLKVPKAMRDDLLWEEGIYPAYHMNKRHWISLDLRKADKRMLEVLMDMSYKATAMKKDL